LEKLGEVCMSSGQKTKAADAFGKALLYNPKAYDVREKLRELNGKRVSSLYLKVPI